LQTLRRTRRISWMVSGWIVPAALGPKGGGTACFTLGCSDDFHAVRLGFANVTPTPWKITKVIGCASTSYGDYVHPTGGAPWRAFTFAMGGRDDDRLVTRPDAPTEITVAGNAVDPATGETGEPAWTWTDWVPLSSVAPDPATGMRVLMLRALVPSEQTVCCANGLLRTMNGNAALNSGFDCFVGGVKFDFDRVSDPTTATPPAQAWRQNGLVNGSLIPIVQFVTAHAGIVGIGTGDSHHQGTATSDQFTGFLYRAITQLGRCYIGSLPFGMVNCAVGGLTSWRFFPRMEVLLRAVRPSFAVLPGWSYNDGAKPRRAPDALATEFLVRLTKAVETCGENGVLPILLTPFPRDRAAMTPPQVAAWRWLRERILGMGDEAAVVLDATALLGRESAEALDGTYLRGTSTDGAHPNDSGHTVVADALSEIVRALCGPSGERTQIAAAAQHAHAGDPIRRTAQLHATL
jgi:hypothetical protein